MPSDRQELATAVLNGEIYVIGGLNENGVSTNNVEVYNPANNTWAVAQPIPTANDHQNAAVAAGKLYSIGGGTNRTFVYDPVGIPGRRLHRWILTMAGRRPWASSTTQFMWPEHGSRDDAARAGSYDPAANSWTILRP